MKLSPSCEAADCAATQELPSVLWNPKVHYRVHTSPPLVPILSQIDPIPIIPSYLSKVGPLSPRHDASLGCGWRKHPPGMEGSCEYIE
jgi:hypothetical protein